ncbi:aspartate kinase [Sulfitobacter sp. BDSS02]|nr:aspartate kinase [Sulfitobacter sp. BDSS02]MBR9850732.1 aspartate kinase [Paracoccaceae bacterium]
MNFPEHTVEKIGGTSMSRARELVDTLFIGDRKDVYNRIFVVSAFGGITNLLLEDKKTGEPGVYGLFASGDQSHAWLDKLTEVANAMRKAHRALLDHPGDLKEADDFVRDRIEGARSCLLDLQRLCSYGHFRLSEHMRIIRELLSGLGEAHSALASALMLRRAGVEARTIDLSGWRDEREMSLKERIESGLQDADPSREILIVTGYAQCREGLMKEYDRGYSEVTFSRIAAMTGAREAIIHKEFHLSSADPKLVGMENVRKLGHTNYDVADQLSNMGMEAIHPKAARTLRQAQVPLRVTNAFEPKDPGTLIDDQPTDTPAAEIVCGLDIYALDLFEQDMLGVKGYDSTILEILRRHNVNIVSKTSNANTITHFLDASFKAIRRVERDLIETYPNADVSVRALSLASVIGRDLSGLGVLGRGMTALDEKGIEVVAAQQPPRLVDVQFIVPRDQLDDTICTMHDLFFGKASKAVEKKAA